MLYLYCEDDSLHFMNPRSFEQVEIDRKVLTDQQRFLKEGVMVNVLFWEKKPLLLELPASLTFEIKETTPGVKGNSATNIWKEAVLENGVRIKVPLFIKKGDLIRVDTRTGEYLERAKANKE